jgi:hypothetical protein
MIRTILGLILIVKLASTAFAFKIHNGRLIEHRKWTTGNAILQIEDITNKNPINSLRSLYKEMKKANFKNKDGILLKNTVDSDGEETRVVGTKVVINGFINAYIENFDSTITKTYILRNNFCLVDSCAKSSYNIELDPGGYFELDVKRAISFTIETPDHYKPILTSLVDGDGLSNDFGTWDTGFINIVK